MLLPFAAGYYLSYLFRTINALIAGDLTAELGLSAADLGLLTSVYFLVFAAVQLPCGVLLDRYGPRTRLSSALLLLASVGSLVFALADGLSGASGRPRADRPRRRLGLDGRLQGHRAVVPAGAHRARQRLVRHAGRARRRDGHCAGRARRSEPSAGAACSPARRLERARAPLLLRAVIVPDEEAAAAAVKTRCSRRLFAIYRDPRFWRIAPLSALGVGTSWSLQGLWAAPWLRDVNGLDRADVVQHLGVMAIAVSASGLASGTGGTRTVRRLGRQDRARAACNHRPVALSPARLSMRASRDRRPCLGVIAAAGAATVLSYAILAERLSEGNLGSGQRGLQPAARRRCLRAAIADGPHHPAVADPRRPPILPSPTKTPWASCSPLSSWRWPGFLAGGADVAGPGRG